MKKKHILVIGNLGIAHKKLKQILGDNVDISLLNPIYNLTGAPSDLYKRIVGIENDNDVEQWLESAKAIDFIQKIDYVFNFHEAYQTFSAKIANELNVNYPYSIETISLVDSKFEMKNRLTELQLNKEPFKKVSTIKDIKLFGDQNGYPLVLKPIDGSGSIGICKINSEKEINGRVKEFKQEASHFEMYIEKFLVGEEFSVEMFSEEGKHKLICITKKYIDKNTYVEIGHCLPADLEHTVEKKIERYVSSILTALNVTSGPTHTEIMLVNDEPNIIETHIRLGGGYIPSLINNQYGIDLIEMQIKQLLGESVLEQLDTRLTDKFSCVWFYCPENSGTIINIKNNLEVKDDIKEVAVLSRIGDEISPTTNSFGRRAYVIAEASSHEEAVNVAKSSVDQIQFDFKK